MKTKIKIETVTQQMFKVNVDQSGISRTFYCTASSIEDALKLAKQNCPNFKIGYAFECVNNWALT
jgi:preprotein translocase subunit SecB